MEKEGWASKGLTEITPSAVMARPHMEDERRWPSEEGEERQFWGVHLRSKREAKPMIIIINNSRKVKVPGMPREPSCLLSSCFSSFPQKAPRHWGCGLDDVNQSSSGWRGESGVESARDHQKDIEAGFGLRAKRRGKRPQPNGKDSGMENWREPLSCKHRTCEVSGCPGFLEQMSS